MGYNTAFLGALKFDKELSTEELDKLSSFLEEDCRDHPEWKANRMTYIDLKLLDDGTGLEWSDREKSYDMVDKINLIIREMRKDFPDFRLNGRMYAQGESAGDIYFIQFNKKGFAYKKDILKKGEFLK